MTTRLYANFLIFHRRNPRVYKLVCRFASEAMRNGHQQYGIAPIWERVRWEITVNSRRNNGDFKMPNNHRAYYARMWLKDHPRHPEFFRTAELRSER